MFKTRPQLDLSRTRSRSIIVSLSEHRISIDEDGVLVKEITEFSIGASGSPTPLVHRGKLDTLRRERIHYSDTHYDSLGNRAAMPFALFFGAGSSCAFHAGDIRRETIGSIHLERIDAEWLFKWAGKDEVTLEILGPNPPAAPTVVQQFATTQKVS